jgi:hypothetical protein
MNTLLQTYNTTRRQLSGAEAPDALLAGTLNVKAHMVFSAPLWSASYRLVSVPVHVALHQTTKALEGPGPDRGTP